LRIEQGSCPWRWLIRAGGGVLLDSWCFFISSFTFRLAISPWFVLSTLLSFLCQEGTYFCSSLIHTLLCNGLSTTSYPQQKPQPRSFDQSCHFGKWS